ncbi:unnamed protein product [Blepharisma stoltei]|uniref:Dickkopf N-terminal cysteine-rich domain-containing protein n=1 Tax=Blepharisma stoltei TaxID=1481888 RepID=A0AAU9J7G4_9CILI|nr:unnamed protein product [Blepharisma stoltei]
MPNFLVFLLLIKYAQPLGITNCYQFDCNTTRTVGTCLDVDHTNRKITLEECAPDYECVGVFKNYELEESEWTNVNCSAKQTIIFPCPTDATLLNGSPCCTASDCASNVCKNSLCIGRSTGATCTSNNQCASTAYCNTASGSGVCTSSSANGESCTSDFTCMPGSGCNNGVCASLFSLTMGKAAQEARFCQTNFLNTNTNICDALQIYLDGFIVYPPFSCLVGDIGVYNYMTDNSTYQTEACGCAGVKDWYRGFFQKYIHNVIGTMSVVWTNLRYSKTSCSAENAHSSSPFVMNRCQSINSDQYNLWYQLNYQLEYWAVYQTGFIDTCADAMGIYDPNYYSDQYTSALYGFALIILGLVVL